MRGALKTYIKIISIIGVYGTFALPSAAQLSNTGLDVYSECGGPFDLCGYMDAAPWKADFENAKRNKIILLGPTFEMTKRFHDGLAAVRIGGKWGYINESFDIVIEPQFDLAGRFHNGLAQVVRENKAGIIGRDGRFIIEPQFAAALPITDSVFIAIPGERKPNIRWGDNTLGYDHLLVLSSGINNAQLYHIEKGPLTKPNLTFKVFDKNNTELIWTKMDDADARWGLIRADGKWEIKPKYQSVTELHMDRAVVSTSKDNFGALDETGRVVIPLKFGPITGWRRGWGDYSRVYKDKKVGALDRHGTLIGGRYFDDYGIPYDTRQTTNLLENGTWFSIGADGKLGPDLGYTVFTCDNGIKMIRYAETVDFIAPNGKKIEGGPFGRNSIRAKECGTPIWVYKGDLFGETTMQSYIMPDATLLGGGVVFEGLKEFRDGFAPAKSDGKWGIIKENGEYQLPPKYDSLESVGKSVYKVKIGGDASYITSDGTPTSQPETQPTPSEKAKERTQYITCRGEASLFNKTSLFRKTIKWGLQSKEGTILVQPEHDLMSCYKNGIAWAPDEDRKAWCPIDRFAKRVEALACKPTYYPYFRTHHFPERFDTDPYNNSVKWTRAYYEYGAGLRNQPPRMIPDRYRRYSDAEIAKIPTEELQRGTYSGYKN